VQFIDYKLVICYFYLLLNLSINHFTYNNLEPAPNKDVAIGDDFIE